MGPTLVDAIGPAHWTLVYVATARPASASTPRSIARVALAAARTSLTWRCIACVEGWTMATVFAAAPRERIRHRTWTTAPVWRYATDL